MRETYFRDSGLPLWFWKAFLQANRDDPFDADPIDFEIRQTEVDRCPVCAVSRTLYGRSAEYREPNNDIAFSHAVDVMGMASEDAEVIIVAADTDLPTLREAIEGLTSSGENPEKLRVTKRVYAARMAFYHVIERTEDKTKKRAHNGTVSPDRQPGQNAVPRPS